MNKSRLAVGGFAIGALSILAIMGQSMPDIGIYMGSSRDAEYVKDGWPIKWDSNQLLFKEADKGVMRHSTSVTLSLGTNTTVTNDNVTDDSKILCGCNPGTPESHGCNRRGRSIALISVTDVRDGEFDIEHGYAMGNERISCGIM